MGNYLGRGMDDITTANITVDKMEGDNAPNGVRNTLTISQRNIPSSINNITVYVDGIQQRAVTDFTLSNSTITFTTAPATGQNVVAVTKGDATLSFISDSTVVAESYADGAITNDKLVSFDASKLTGAFGAIDGSALTGIKEVTVVSSDPTVTTNPDNVGDIYVNSTTGEMFSCTDKTAGANVWINVGGGEGGVEPYVFQGTLEGYVAGGQVVGSPAHNNIQKFSYASSTTKSDLGDLTRASYLVSGASSSTHGYQAGGLNVSTIDKFQFATSDNATSHGSLTGVRHSSAATNDGTHGFVMGGQSFLASIEKYSFASNSTAATHGNLTEASNGKMCCSSGTHGIVGGGFNSGLSPMFRTTVDKFSFASNSTASGHGNLSTARSSGSATSSTTDGFMAGGGSSVGDQIVVEKVSFASNSVASSHGNLSNDPTSAERDGIASSSHTTHGYSMGGQRNSGPANAKFDVVDKFAYASNTTAADHGDLVQGSYYASGHQY